LRGIDAEAGGQEKHRAYARGDDGEIAAPVLDETGERLARTPKILPHLSWPPFDGVAPLNDRLQEPCRSRALPWPARQACRK
jgi:hypothetical protein